MALLELDDGKYVLFEENDAGLPSITDIPRRYVRYMGYDAYIVTKGDNSFMFNDEGSMRGDPPARFTVISGDLELFTSLVEYDRNQVRETIQGILNRHEP